MELTRLAEASGWRRAFAWLIFPITFGGSLALTAYAQAKGVKLELTPMVGIVPGALVVMAAERIQPHSPRWTRSHGDVWTDALHVGLSQMLPPPLIDALFKVTLAGAAVALAERVGGTLWPISLPLGVSVALAAVLSELLPYGWHRLCHESAFFWRFHATHHSAPRLWWLNAARFHPIDAFVGYALTALPLVLLGCPPEAIALLATFTAVHGLFQHSNIDLRLGPLNWVFSMAELHRWHHSRDLALANANYGANVIFWDIVFRTRKLPKDRDHDPADVGFEGDERFPQTYWGQVASVFRFPKEPAIAFEIDREARRDAPPEA